MDCRLEAEGRLESGRPVPSLEDRRKSRYFKGEVTHVRRDSLAVKHSRVVVLGHSI